MKIIDDVLQTESAGGLLFRAINTEIELLIVERTKDVEPKWYPALRQLPKGGVESGETLQQTALREVLEETGYQATILNKAGTASWTYERDGRKWAETVHYFFMRPTSDIPLPHDDEFDRVFWAPIEKAITLLSYPEERDLITKVLENDKVVL
jgi:8-oxo-dGTP pyrophosphatase MutT (NUDIX family)